MNSSNITSLFYGYFLIDKKSMMREWMDGSTCYMQCDDVTLITHRSVNILHGGVINDEETPR